MACLLPSGPLFASLSSVVSKNWRVQLHTTDILDLHPLSHDTFLSVSRTEICISRVSENTCLVIRSIQVKNISASVVFDDTLVVSTESRDIHSYSLPGLNLVSSISFNQRISHLVIIQDSIVVCSGDTLHFLNTRQTVRFPSDISCVTSADSIAFFGCTDGNVYSYSYEADISKLHHLESVCKILFSGNILVSISSNFICVFDGDSTYKRETPCISNFIIDGDVIHIFSLGEIQTVNISDFYGIYFLFN
jgi:hypothetical protein